jgi:hypothetical protein
MEGFEPVFHWDVGDLDLSGEYHAATALEDAQNQTNNL